MSAGTLASASLGAHATQLRRPPPGLVAQQRNPTRRLHGAAVSAFGASTLPRSEADLERQVEELCAQVEVAETTREDTTAEGVAAKAVSIWALECRSALRRRLRIELTRPAGSIRRQNLTCGRAGCSLCKSRQAHTGAQDSKSEQSESLGIALSALTGLWGGVRAAGSRSSTSTGEDLRLGTAPLSSAHRPLR